MKTCCNMNMSRRLVTLTGGSLMALMMWTWYPSAALATCNVTSNGSGSVGRITKFTPSPCNIENSVIFESSGKIGIGGPPQAPLNFRFRRRIKSACWLKARLLGSALAWISKPQGLADCNGRFSIQGQRLRRGGIS